MSNKFNLLTVVVVSILALSCCNASEYLWPEDLYENYARVNKYLVKNVQSADPELNMAAAENYCESLMEKSRKHMNFNGEYLIETLKSLRGFAGFSSGMHRCDTSAQKSRLMKLVEESLADKSRLNTPNYPLTRVDRIVEHYAIQDAIRCGYTKGLPKLEYGYKQIAYDNINGLLEQALPEVEDADANMAKAEELMNGMPDGALADALRQLLQLRTLLDEDTCGEEGYETLLKNDLATRREAVDGRQAPKRRVGKIVQHYAKQHEQLCRPIVPSLIKSVIETLDQDSYRRVLGMVAARFLDQSQLDKLIMDLNGKQVDENFSTPLLLDYVAKQICDLDPKAKFQLDHEPWVTPETLYGYIVAVSAEDPLAKHIYGTHVAKPQANNFYHKGRRDFTGLDKLLGKYLFEPCIRFLSAVGRSIRADDYCVNVNMFHVGSTRDEFIKEISYHTARAGYFACKFVLDKQENVMQMIMDTSIKPSKPAHFDEPLHLSSMFDGE